MAASQSSRPISSVSAAPFVMVPIGAPWMLSPSSARSTSYPRAAGTFFPSQSPAYPKFSSMPQWTSPV